MMNFLLTIICFLLLILVIVLYELLKEVKKMPAKVTSEVRQYVFAKINDLDKKIERIKNAIK